MITRLLSDGGPLMYVILILLLLSLFFIVKAFLTMNKSRVQSKKMIGLANETSILSLVVGCFGSVFSLISLFDMVEAIGETRPDLFSAGLKVALLTITFGLFSFVIARIGILAYKWTLKPEV
ncbi:hypothetical protein [Psychroserpens sp. SPM9]|uniref:hypothetical protein n=1 Tax=Psychroserpens sp. SPM9 TaxID=2975598 RepID=UPI0021A3DBCD|nr:hypothetical protein [Psychroserpens sp. SPM9]MDG5491786.1 hypothetical protein [Psychroserpens sp. SPM9]